MNDKKILIEKIREFNIDQTSKKRRDDFLSSNYGKIFSKRDIENNGGWASIFELATGNKAFRWRNKIETINLFEEYSKKQDELKIFDRPLLATELGQIGSTFKRRFPGGSKKWYIEYNKWLNRKTRHEVPDAIFNGKAAEYLFVSALLFRKYNAQLITVDDGMDILAFKNGRFYFFQIKHGEYNVDIKITKTSYDKNQMSNVFYIFILSNNKNKDFIIIPVFKFDELISKNGQNIMCKILRKNEKIYINNISDKNEITRYLNDNGWSLLSRS